MRTEPSWSEPLQHYYIVCLTCIILIALYYEPHLYHAAKTVSMQRGVATILITTCFITWLIKDCDTTIKSDDLNHTLPRLIFFCVNEIVLPTIHTCCRGGTMFGFGMPEMIIILVIVLVVFGAGKLPEIGGALGKSIRNFKKASDGKDEIEIKPKSEDTDKKA